ncbi:head protein [Aristophania vespae]|uniref:Head protein n=1 Tax=Aristophania vespae TaxID=2697033 RepID=A0A6P1NK58_9PROT|nr:Mu-like prophage major head subunit gpT family protein [Aristophania vespae]QHI96052.1 head protein [Aristophania vespae]UMM63819.1 hypothetical protein DM15PD_07960 [Aristophania vespae]
MDINIGNINALTTRVNLAFNKYIETVDTHYQPFTMVVPSSAGENLYPRLMELPGFREWFGQRVVHRIGEEGRISVANRTFEQTFSIRREDIEDDQMGFLTPIVQQLASDAASLPDKLIFELLENGHKNRGMDGQYFFDPDHEAYDQTGTLTAFSNIMRPASGEATTAAWYLFNTRQPMKPMIFQNRRKFVIQARTQLQQGNVFNGNEFVWGADGRCAAGYGLHNFAFRSTAPLTAENLGKAIGQMQAQYRRDGTPYNTRPDMIFVPTSLEGPARQLIEKDFLPTLAPDGKTYVTGSNPWSRTAKLVVCPYLNPLAVSE